MALLPEKVKKKNHLYLLHHDCALQTLQPRGLNSSFFSLRISLVSSVKNWDPLILIQTACELPVCCSIHVLCINAECTGKELITEVLVSSTSFFVCELNIQLLPFPMKSGLFWGFFSHKIRIWAICKEENTRFRSVFNGYNFGQIFLNA